jgi:hypothetical protein
MRTWLIYFEDTERGIEVYTSEDAALRAFQEHSQNWNCTLFVSVLNNFTPTGANP